MQSMVLWAIDNELEGAKFERLCVDLLYRNGYKEIVPIEPQDGGRDAEELPRKGRDRDGCSSFFQFSLEAGWKAKIRKDATKLHSRGAQFTDLIFVTSRKVRGVDIDQLRAEFRSKYGWTLIVYSREWLRLQLEEANTDLSMKYLGIRIEAKPKTPSWVVGPRLRAKTGLKPALRSMESGAFDRTIDLLLGFLDSQPESAVAWQLLAWAEYRLERYDEALSHINRALKVREEPRFELVRACILAEKGIRDQSKPELRLAESLFRAGLSKIGDDGGMAHYNLGNVLSALREFPDAIQQYKLALKQEKNRPEIWKNLGSAYHESGDHESEMKCLDRALELDPLLPEALASKAVSFIVDLSKPQEAIPLLEAAYRSQPAIATRWPKFWYWLVTGCVQANNLPQAFKWVEEGLSHQPGSRSLSHLKSNILTKLRDVDSVWASRAHAFWTGELAAEAMNFEARKQLALAENAAGNAAKAWKLVDGCLPLFDFEAGISLQDLGLNVEQCLDAVEFLPQYIRFRASFPLSNIWEPTSSKDFSEEMNLNVQKHLSVYLAIPFGIGYRQLKKDGKDLTAFFDAIRQPLIWSFVTSVRRFSPSIDAASGDARKMAALATSSGALLANAAQYEFMYQASWMPGVFEIGQEQVTAAFVAYPKIDVSVNVLTESVIELMRAHLPLQEGKASKAAPSRLKKRTQKTPRKATKR
ncbi:MAG: tetratricopeptide repeat protein [Terracidiphilus sp.]